MGKTADLTVVQKTVIDTRHMGLSLGSLLKKMSVQSAPAKHSHRHLSGRKKCGRKRDNGRGLSRKVH